VRGEDPNEAWEFVKKHVRKGSRIHADEHFSYDDLAGLQDLFRVNHSKEYQTKDGINTNHVESRCATSTGTRRRSPGARTTATSTTACCCDGPLRDVQEDVAEPVRLLAVQPPARFGLGGRRKSRRISR
jgi:hypothetical protein